MKKCLKYFQLSHSILSANSDKVTKSVRSHKMCDMFSVGALRALCQLRGCHAMKQNLQKCQKKFKKIMTNHKISQSVFFISQSVTKVLVGPFHSANSDEVTRSSMKSQMFGNILCPT